MKLFQIEEPEGGPAGPDAPGAAIGINASGDAVEVAISVGGNAVVLSDREGFEQRLAVPDLDALADGWLDMFARARVRAERAIARPVTYAVIVLAAAPERAVAARLTNAATRAGLALLRLATTAEPPFDAPAPVLAAAQLAEDLAPRPEPGAASMADFT